MKQVTINVSEPVYRIFQEYARSQDRTASEIIREAMELYRVEKIENKNSLQDLYPVSVGKILQQPAGREDFLDEMIHESGY
jgi:hypothetical protein